MPDVPSLFPTAFLSHQGFGFHPCERMVGSDYRQAREHLRGPRDRAGQQSAHACVVSIIPQSRPHQLLVGNKEGMRRWMAGSNHDAHVVMDSFRVGRARGYLGIGLQLSQAELVDLAPMTPRAVGGGK